MPTFHTPFAELDLIRQPEQRNDPLQAFDAADEYLLRQVAADGLAGQPADSLDVVLCNPPFHQQQVVGDFLAWRMFQQARHALVSGGQLWIVGNRHLGYHAKLKRLFRGVEQVAANPKFVVLKASK